MSDIKKSGVELIAQEREEHFKKHGRTISEDAMQNNNFELRRAAVALLENNPKGFSGFWNKEICEKMSEKSYKERLIIAGSLICAEIDRIQFYQSPSATDKK